MTARMILVLLAVVVVSCAPTGEEQWVSLTDTELTLQVSCRESEVNSSVEVPYNHPFVDFDLSWTGAEDVWIEVKPPKGNSYLILHVWGGGLGFTLNGLIDGDISRKEYPSLPLSPGKYTIIAWNDPYTEVPEHKAFQVEFFIPECG